MITTIPLPSFCLTLTPPWPQAIAYAGKRLENRHASVAKGIGSYRGQIGLSQSKNWDDLDAMEALASFGAFYTGNLDEKWREFRAWAGRLVLVADLVDILPPDRCDGADWHVSGQWGLILGQVYEVEPVACMGGQGAWRPQWCPVCAKVIADSHGKVCKLHQRSLTPGSEAPALRVVREI